MAAAAGGTCAPPAVEAVPLAATAVAALLRVSEVERAACASLMPGELPPGGDR